MRQAGRSCYRQDMQDSSQNVKCINKFSKKPLVEKMQLARIRPQESFRADDIQGISQCSRRSGRESNGVPQNRSLERYHYNNPLR